MLRINFISLHASFEVELQEKLSKCRNKNIVCLKLLLNKLKLLDIVILHLVFNLCPLLDMLLSSYKIEIKEKLMQLNSIVLARCICIGREGKLIQ